MFSVAIYGRTVYQDPSYHVLVSGGRAALWGKGVQEVVWTRDSESGWVADGSNEGIRGGGKGERIIDRGRDGKKSGGMVVANNNI